MALQDIFTTFSQTSDPTALYQQIANYLHVPLGILYILFAAIAIWSIVWKGLALWKSAKKGHVIWFIILLTINTVGILDILYIYIFSNMGKKSAGSKPVEKVEKGPADKKKKR